jgi:hypothetical protein
MRDRDKKGRQVALTGEEHARSKLTEKMVCDMRARYLSGETKTALAERFGVTRQNVRHVVTRRTWRHVP